MYVSSVRVHFLIRVDKNNEGTECQYLAKNCIIYY